MRRAEQAPRAFQAPVDVHASADGQMYMFKRRSAESAVCSEDEELSAVEMQPYHTHSPNHSMGQVLERELQHGDNLNKLALQYGCQVADIKRLNNLMQEQDLFALKSIKIPVQKHSLLTELGEVQPPQDLLPPSPEDGAPRAPPHVREVTDFLMELDNDMERLIQSTEQEDEKLLKVWDRQDSGHRKQGGQGIKGHGSDWGINWWNAVVAMLLIGIVLPLFYIIYFKTRPAEDGPVQYTPVTNSSVGGTQGPVQEPG